MKEDQELNGLPKDWRWEQLGKACEVITGTTPPKADPSNYGSDLPFFKPPHLWDGTINNTDEMLSLKGAAKSRVVPPNSVLVTCIGNLGRTGFVKKKAAFNQQINAILENENVNGKYIFYQAQSPFFKKQLEALATGTTVSIVNKGNFETISIPIPPKEVQQQIVSKIEELFSELDKGIEELKTAQQQLKVYRQAVLKWAFEGKYSKGADDWKLMKLKEASLKVVVGYVGPITEHVVTKGGIPFLSTTHIGENEFLYHEIREVSNSFNEQNKKSQVIPGDILIARHGDSGKSCIVPDSINVAQVSNAVILRPNPQVVLSKFVCYRLNSERQRMQKMKVGGVFQVVNTKSMESFEISIPPLEEQQHIIQEIESRLSVCDKMEETIIDSLKQAEALRQSILKNSFKGQL